jgi:hypothetical protein
LSRCLALANDEMADLAHVIQAWPTLPQPLKAGVLALIKAAMT